MATEMRWNKNDPSRASPVTAVILRPSSVMNDLPESFIGPIKDSKANGQKMCVRARSEYFVTFFVSAFSAAILAVAEVDVLFGNNYYFLYFLFSYCPRYCVPEGVIQIDEKRLF